MLVVKRPGAIPFTRTPSGRSSWAREDVACPIADLENAYGYEEPAVARSYVAMVLVALMFVKC